MAKDKGKSTVYSALEVANICGVVNQTAINWIKADYLRAFKTPGGQYRVYPDDLAVFMQSRGMEIPEILAKNCTRQISYSQKTILIVDDDKGLNSVVSKFLLKKYGDLEVFQAFDGFEAGALMSKEHPGCVILDLGLPGVDGFALCQRINEDESFGNPEIIVITALNDGDLEGRLMELGIRKVFKKPLNLEEIAQSVGEWYHQ